MVTIYIFADSHKQFSDALREYQKRLGKQLEIRELKPVKKWNPKEIIHAETEILREKLQKESAYIVVLSPKGKNISTEELWVIIEQKKCSGEKVIFVIGGANGLDYGALKNIVDFELSLGAMTLPHSLALTVLVEQIYRCSEIERGSQYHK